eukprot:FR740794.1.p2 GENE.FR740794.1~~FR740794.1.p2  ORF type:complete len:106 (+),score=20.55 FR740794.1:38-319(+)
MDIEPAQAIKRRLAADPSRVVRCFELSNAGHQLMIDQPESFNNIVLKVINDAEEVSGLTSHDCQIPNQALEAIKKMEDAGSGTHGGTRPVRDD